MTNPQTAASPLPAPRGQATKYRAVLDAATAIFCATGIRGASIDAIAARAGVSRQTVYNQMGDKEALFSAVVKDLADKASAKLFEVLAAFPESPASIEAALVDFAEGLVTNWVCDPDCAALRRLMDNEGQRHPELFLPWKQHGPGRTWPVIAARFSALVRQGVLDIDDVELAARQFMTLVHGDLTNFERLGERPTQAEMHVSAVQAVRFFLRAYGVRPGRPLR